MKSFVYSIVISAGLVLGLTGCQTMQQQPQLTQAQQIELARRQAAVEKADAAATQAQAAVISATNKSRRRRAQRRANTADAIAAKRRRELAAYEQVLYGTSNTATNVRSTPTRRTYSTQPQNQNTREGLREAAGTVRDVRGLVNEIRSLRYGW